MDNCLAPTYRPFRRAVSKIKLQDASPGTCCIPPGVWRKARASHGSLAPAAFNQRTLVADVILQHPQLLSRERAVVNFFTDAAYCAALKRTRNCIGDIARTIGPEGRQFIGGDALGEAPAVPAVDEQARECRLVERPARVGRALSQALTHHSDSLARHFRDSERPGAAPPVCAAGSSTHLRDQYFRTAISRSRNGGKWQRWLVCAPNARSFVTCVVERHSIGQSSVCHAQ